MSRGALVLLCLLIAGPATASEVARPQLREGPCEVVEYGMYVPLGSQVDQLDDPGATGLWTAVDDVKFVEQTRTIRRELGKSFGFRFRVRDVASHRPLKVTWRIVYPKPLPAWERRFEVRVSDGVLAQHLGYQFEKGWEMSTGAWRFEVLVDGKRACTMSFTVI